MVKTKTKIYDATGEDPMETMVDIAQSTLEELEMEIRTQYLDKTLVEINAKGNGSRNLVTVYYEDEKIYVKFKSTMDDPNNFWGLFESNMAVFGDTSTESIEEKALTVNKIIDAVQNMGYQISEDDCWDFLLSFEKQYETLPSEEQIQSIALSYTKMCQEQGIEPGEIQDGSVFVGDDEAVQDEETLVTPTEALKEIVLEIETLTEEDKTFFIGLFDDLTLDEQKRLVTRIRGIESDLDKIPYLQMEERADIRKKIMNLPTKKRRAKILKIIKKRKKDLQKYANAAMEEDLRNALDKMEFLSDLEKDIHMGRLQEFSLDDKKKYLKRLKIVEDSLTALIKDGIKFSDAERRTFRDDLLRMNKQKRNERLKEIREEKSFEQAEEELLAEIPSLRFEEHEKEVREIMWLEPSERKKEIDGLKNQFESETEKTSKVLEDSKVGSKCPKCGWIVGSFSSKCPRCGHKLGFHI